MAKKGANMKTSDRDIVFIPTRRQTARPVVIDAENGEFEARFVGPAHCLFDRLCVALPPLHRRCVTSWQFNDKQKPMFR